MEFIIGLLSALLGLFAIRNVVLKRSNSKLKQDVETKTLKGVQDGIAVKKKKIKDDVDGQSLDDLVNRKRDESK